MSRCGTSRPLWSCRQTTWPRAVTGTTTPRSHYANSVVNRFFPGPRAAVAQRPAPFPGGGVRSGSSVPHMAEMLGNTFLTPAVVSRAGRTSSSHGCVEGQWAPFPYLRGAPHAFLAEKPEASVRCPSMRSLWDFPQHRWKSHHPSPDRRRPVGNSSPPSARGCYSEPSSTLFVCPPVLGLLILPC